MMHPAVERFRHRSGVHTDMSADEQADTQADGRDGTPVRLALLNGSPNPDRTAENFRRVFTDVVDGDVSIDDYRVQELAFPDPDEYDAAVVSGSADSVYDDAEHVDALREWIRDADLPILGVCYGHQAIVDAYGGTVEELSAGELGYVEVEHDGDAFFDGVPERFVCFQSHGDAVTELPPGAEPLARNDVCLQAMRLDDHVSVQFHPEIGLEYGRDLVDGIESAIEDEADDGSGDENGVSDDNRDFEAVRATLTAKNERRSEAVHAIFGNFLRQVE